LKELNNTIDDLKMGIETIKKSQRETTLEIEKTRKEVRSHTHKHKKQTRRH
jgi:chaperonin cofactor prefoldin